LIDLFLLLRHITVAERELAAKKWMIFLNLAKIWKLVKLWK